MERTLTKYLAGYSFHEKASMEKLWERRVDFAVRHQYREESECKTDWKLALDPCDEIPWYKREVSQHLFTDDEYRGTFVWDLFETELEISVGIDN